MRQNLIVPERDVLAATAVWLKQRGVIPYLLSVARGRGIDIKADTAYVREVCVAAGIPDKVIRTVATGPDVVALSRTEFWQVECKGSGSGTPQTMRNNFDRALASTVSYYTDVLPPDLIGEFPQSQPHIGLAFPSTRVYMNELKKRVGQPLRQRLNMWVLLYDSEHNRISPIPPSQPI